MKRIKIAVLGILHAHGLSNFKSILTHSEVFEFVGLCPDYETKEEMDKGQIPAEDFRRGFAELQKEFGKIPILSFEELLAYPGLEAVAIESYEADLTKYAIAAAKRGLHIFMDKPGGESVSDFARLIALAKEQNLVLNFGYMYRKNPAVVALLDMIKQGELGKVTCVEAHIDCDHTDRVRAWLGNFQGGMTYFLGCHLIDLIYRIQGKPNKIIPMNASTGISGVQSKDYGFAVFEYDTGPSFFKTSAAEFGGFMRRQLVVTGTEGSVEIKPLEYFKDGKMYTDMRVVTRKQNGKENWNAFGEVKTFGPIERYDVMLLPFAAQIRGEQENDYSYDYELGLFRLIAEVCGIKEEEA